MGKRSITIKLTPKTGAFERLSGWVGSTLVVNTEGGEGSGSAERTKPDVAVSVEAKGRARSTYECEYGCTEHPTVKKTFTLDKNGDHDERAIRC